MIVDVFVEDFKEDSNQIMQAYPINVYYPLEEINHYVLLEVYDIDFLTSITRMSTQKGIAPYHNIKDDATIAS